MLIACAREHGQATTSARARAEATRRTHAIAADGAADEATLAAASALPASTEPLDQGQLATLAAVLPPRELQALVRSSVEAAAGRLERIRNSAAAADLAGLAREAHDLKGVAGNFGARRVAELARAACRSDEAEAAARIVGEIERASADTCRVLSELYELYLAA